MKPWLRCDGQTVRLALYIQPGAKKTELCGEHGTSLKIRVAAPPVDDKANAALLLYLSQRFALGKRGACLLSGDKSRHKLVELDCALAAEEVLQLLQLTELPN